MRLPISDSLAKWIVKKAKEAPYEHLGTYMKRYWFIVTPWFKMRVHEILRSDREFHLHSHPWTFITLILFGGYWELRPVWLEGKDGWHYYQDKPRHDSEIIEEIGPEGEREVFYKTWYGPGSIIRRKAGEYHRVILPEGQITTTLFMTGQQQVDWGFLREGRFVFWREYLNDWSI